MPVGVGDDLRLLPAGAVGAAFMFGFTGRTGSSPLVVMLGRFLAPEIDDKRSRFLMGGGLGREGQHGVSFSTAHFGARVLSQKEDQECEN